MTATLDTTIEPFVAADVAAKVLCISRRRLLEMARAKDIPAHPIGHGRRKTWRFRLSELAEVMVDEKQSSEVPRRGIIDVGSPRQPNRRN
jgi:hypothetical protein